MMPCCGAKRGRMNGREAEKCDDCRSWEEQLYWKRFQPLHFCQILRPGSEFQKEIIIPRKFAHNAKPILPPTVTLRGPSSVSWSAMMIKRGDDYFLSDGWEEFVKAYTLQANNILIFKYDGVSVFDVLIFDGENFCEKESAYFVKKCAHADPSTERQRKRVSSEANIEENDDNHMQKATKQARKEVDKKSVDETPKKLNNSKSNESRSRRKKTVARKGASPEANTRERTPIHTPLHTSENLCDSFAMLAELGKTIVQNATSYMEPENTTEINGTDTPKVNGSSQDTPQVNGTASARSKRAGKKNSLNETSLQKVASPKGKQKKASGSRGKQQSSKKKVASSAVPLNMQPSALDGTDMIPFDGSADRPKRNYVSEEGKVAIEMARKQMNDNSFLLVLRPTNVYKRFMVTVPPAWFKKHLLPKSQNVFLRFDDKTWITKLGYSPIKATGQICGGWKQFVQDNRLEEFDVCVFSFVSQNENEAIVDVSICRAGPTMATPISQVMMDDTPMLIIED